MLAAEYSLILCAIVKVHIFNSTTGQWSPALRKALYVSRHAMRVFKIIVFFVLAACSNPQQNGKAKIVETEGALRQDFHQKLVSAMNLPNLKNGTDSFELRVWSNASMVDLSSLTVLRFSDGGWNLQNIFYWMRPLRDFNLPVIIDSSFTRRRDPSITYSALLDSIKYFNLEAMPMQDSIPGFVDKTGDGTSYVLEVSRPSFYKMIKYRNPQFYSDTTNTNYLNFLKFFGRQTGADVPK